MRERFSRELQEHVGVCERVDGWRDHLEGRGWTEVDGLMDAVTLTLPF